MIIARQSTARTVMIGPVLDSSGAAVTDCVVADFEGSVNGGDPAALNGSATLTHRGVGFYSLALTATDLATVGSFEVSINDTTNGCAIKEITVIEEAVYDAIYAASATGLLPANVTQFGGSNGTFSGGRPEVNASHWGGTAVASANVLIDNAITSAKINDGAFTVAKFAAAFFPAIWDVLSIDVTSGIGDFIRSTLTNLSDRLTATRAGYLDKLNTGVTLTAQQAIDLVSAIEAEIADDATGEAIKQAIIDKLIENLPDLDELTLAAIASAVWSAATRRLTDGTNIVLAKGTGVTGFNDLSAAQVNAEVDSAIETYHLDHLLAADYDPTSKPGVATALLNELVENDGGVSRFTENALEQAPSGGGGGGISDEDVATIVAAVRGVRVAGPVLTFQGQPVKLVQRDDRIGDFTIPWSISNAAGLPDFSNLTVCMRAIIETNGEEHSADSEDQAPSVATGSSRSGRVPWENAAADLPKGLGRYQFVFKDEDDHEVTLIEGPLTLV